MDCHEIPRLYAQRIYVALHGRRNIINSTNSLLLQRSLAEFMPTGVDRTHLEIGTIPRP
jgi:hypothetical protein